MLSGCIHTVVKHHPKLVDGAINLDNIVVKWCPHDMTCVCASRNKSKVNGQPLFSVWFKQYLFRDN